ncbi:hypothetical protein [Flavobacterium panici]|nr:hypothetical protein [Flavobacterium panici]
MRKIKLKLKKSDQLWTGSTRAVDFDAKKYLTVLKAGRKSNG